MSHISQCYYHFLRHHHHNTLCEARAVATNFIWGFNMGFNMGADKREAECHERVGEFFWKVFFEMVHFGAKVTNAVHHNWFSGNYREKTDLRLIHFLS